MLKMAALPRWARFFLSSCLLLPLAAQAVLTASVTVPTGFNATVFPGEVTRLEITLTNDVSSEITALGFNTSLPSSTNNGLKIAGEATLMDCGSGALTATLGGTQIKLDGGTIAALSGATPGTCKITVPVKAWSTDGVTSSQTYTIAANVVSGTQGGSTVKNEQGVSQGITVNAASRPTLTKGYQDKVGNSVSYADIGGDERVLVLKLTNPNTMALTGVTLEDNFPVLGSSSTPAFVVGSGASSNDCHGALTASENTAQVTLTGGTIPAGGACIIKVPIKGSYAGVSRTTTVNNTIQVANFTNDAGLTLASAVVAPISINSRGFLSKTVAPTVLADGATGRFTLKLQNGLSTPQEIDKVEEASIDGNVGGLTVTGVTTTCLDSSVTPVTLGDRGFKVSGGRIPASTGPFSPGECHIDVDFTGTATLGTPRVYTNTIPVADSNFLKNKSIYFGGASAAVTVVNGIRVLKSASPANPAPGDAVVYRVTVENYSDKALTDVKMTDTLPTGMTLLTNSSYAARLEGAGCNDGLVTSGTNPYTFTFNMKAAVGSGPAQCAVVFSALVPATATGKLSNTIAENNVCYTPAGGSATCDSPASPSAEVTVNTPILKVAKAFDGVTEKTLPAGTVSRLRITLNNASAQALTDVALTDNFPVSGSVQLRVAPIPEAQTTCGGPSAISATAGNTSIGMSGATVPGKGSCTLEVNVVGDAGVYPNTAQVTSARVNHANGTTYHDITTIDSNTATLTYLSALEASKAFSPATVGSGGRSTVTVTVQNKGSAPLDGVTVEDPLPANMVIATPANARTTCAGATSINATPGAGNGSGSAILSGANLPAGGRCDFIFDVSVSGTPSTGWMNTIPVGKIHAASGVSNQSPVTATLNYAALAAPTISKAVNPSTLKFPGEPTRLTLTLTAGGQSLTGLAVTDYFTVDGTAGGAANGMLIAAVPAVESTCADAVVTATPGERFVRVTGARLNANQQCTVTLNVTSTSTGAITNIIPAASILSDQGVSNSGEATTSLQTQSNLGLTKQFVPAVVAPGAVSRLHLTILNPIANMLTDVAVTDNLPSGLIVATPPNVASTCNGMVTATGGATQISLAGGSLAAASGINPASCTIEVDVVAAVSGSYVNRILAGQLTAKSNGSTVQNQEPPAEATLRVLQPLSIHKAFAQKTLDAGALPTGWSTGTASSTPGAPFSLSIVLSNPNASPLNGLHFDDVLPSGLVIAPTPDAHNDCGGSLLAAPSGTTVRLTGGTLAANGSCTITVKVLSNIAGSYTNTLVAGSVGSNEGVSNTSATSAKVNLIAPPTLSKSFNPPSIAPNGVSQLTLTLGNAGSQPLTLSADLVDTLPTSPGNLLVATENNLSSTCGTVTAAAGSGTITLASGSSIPPGGCTIKVNGVSDFRD